MTTNELYVENISISHVSPLIYYSVLAYYYLLFRHKGSIQHLKIKIRYNTICSMVNVSQL